MEITPDLRLALSGARPLPLPTPRPDASESRPSTAVRTATRSGGAGSQRPTLDRWPIRGQRQLRQLVRWYLAPSGLLAAAALLLIAIGIAAPGLWRLVGVVGVLLLAAFLPYRFLREQRHSGSQISFAIREEARRQNLVPTLAKLRRDLGIEIDRAAGDLTQEMDRRSTEAASALRTLRPRARAHPRGGRYGPPGHCNGGPCGPPGHRNAGCCGPPGHSSARRRNCSIESTRGGRRGARPGAPGGYQPF